MYRAHSSLFVRRFCYCKRISNETVCAQVVLIFVYRKSGFIERFKSLAGYRSEK